MRDGLSVPVVAWQMPHVFRPSQSHRRWTIAAIVFLSTVGTAGAWFFWTEGVPQWRVVAATCYAGIFFGFALTGVWDYVVVGCSTISIDQQRLVYSNPFRQEVIEFRSVIRARWLQHHAGIELYTDVRRLKIYFDNYEQPQRWTLIHLLRDHVPEDRHVDWPLFCHRVALPRRIGNTNRPLRPGEVVLHRGRWDWFFVVLGAVCAIIGFVFWFLIGHADFFIALVFLLLSWIFLRLMTPKSGVIVKASAVDWSFTRPWLVLFLLIWPVLFLGERIGAMTGHAELGMALSCIPFVVAMFYFSHRADKQKKQADLHGAPHSVAEWIALGGK